MWFSQTDPCVWHRVIQFSARLVTSFIHSLSVGVLRGYQMQNAKQMALYINQCGWFSPQTPNSIVLWSKRRFLAHVHWGVAKDWGWGHTPYYHMPLSFLRVLEFSIRISESRKQMKTEVLVGSFSFRVMHLLLSMFHLLEAPHGPSSC